MERQITCINKLPRNDPYNAITHVGGSWGKIAQAQAIDDIENRRHNYFVSVRGDRVEVIVANRNGRKYLKTRADGDEPNNLLSLPECR